MVYALRHRKLADSPPALRKENEPAIKRTKIEAIKKRDLIDYLHPGLLPTSAYNKLKSHGVQRVMGLTKSAMEKIQKELESNEVQGEDKAWMNLLFYISSTPVKDVDKSKLNIDAWRFGSTLESKGNFYTNMPSTDQQKALRNVEMESDSKEKHLDGNVNMNESKRQKQLEPSLYTVDHSSIGEKYNSLKRKKEGEKEEQIEPKKRKIEATPETFTSSPQPMTKCMVHGESSFVPDCKSLQAVKSELIEIPSCKSLVVHQVIQGEEDLKEGKENLIEIPSGKNLILKGVIESPAALVQQLNELHHVDSFASDHNNHCHHQDGKNKHEEKEQEKQSRFDPVPIMTVTGSQTSRPSHHGPETPKTIKSSKVLHNSQCISTYQAPSPVIHFPPHPMNILKSPSSSAGVYEVNGAATVNPNEPNAPIIYPSISPVSDGQVGWITTDKNDYASLEL